MNALAPYVYGHARRISDEQLVRVGPRLGRLAPAQRMAVDELARTLAERIAESLVEEARRDRALAAALDLIYGVSPGRSGAGPSGLAVDSDKPAEQAAPLPADGGNCNLGRRRRDRAGRGNDRASGLLHDELLSVGRYRPQETSAA
ncbi:MAG TPA: hypothetical protein VEK39_12030 [Solirubrobacterales bacterium]|nr:hypothetical protein [Solirubrobacterales bacterium]